MLKETRCVRYHETIRVQGSTEESNAIPQVPLEFPCLVCQTTNTVLWHKGATYTVDPAN